VSEGNGVAAQGPGKSLVKLGVWPIDEMLKTRRGPSVWDYLWLFVAGGFFVGALAVWTIGEKSGGDSPFYLLSSIAQSLAAIVALTVTLPLAYHASSKYVGGAVRYVVRSPVLVSYVVLYAVTIAIALLSLTYQHPPSALRNLAVALSFGCLASIIPFIWWVSHALRPEAYIDEVLTPEYGRLSALLTSRSATPKAMSSHYSELQKVYESALSLASEAARNGATWYAQVALTFVVAAAIGHDESTPSQASQLARNCLFNFLRGSTREQGAGEITGQAIMLSYCVAFAGRRTPSLHLANALLGMMLLIALETAQTESATGGAIAALWIIGLATLGADAKSDSVDAIAVATARVMRERHMGDLSRARRVAQGWLEQNLHGELANLATGADEFERRVRTAIRLLVEES
jgi:hypothetical protein